MIINPVFNKSGEFYFKKSNKQNKQKQSAEQETKTSNLFEKQKNLRTHVKKPTKSLECIDSAIFNPRVTQKVNQINTQSLVHCRHINILISLRLRLQVRFASTPCAGDVSVPCYTFTKFSRNFKVTICLTHE